ncbi:hypothetical protein X979_5835 [Burkholderia pseudomallei MSHR7527]|nr:hypothetical protein X977_4423 [Burkholderia pseudomallei MSHR7504]KGS71041.1 hypothetical protein X979_5835 [Burkholderia pseudomallei MSHR7527]KGW74076.1 hypothetical protein Y046_6141 [Burkholderia pseudomallei MSHR2990]
MVYYEYHVQPFHHLCVPLFSTQRFLPIHPALCRWASWHSGHFLLEQFKSKLFKLDV